MLTKRQRRELERDDDDDDSCEEVEDDVVVIEVDDDDEEEEDESDDDDRDISAGGEDGTDNDDNDNNNNNNNSDLEDDDDDDDDGPADRVMFHSMVELVEHCGRRDVGLWQTPERGARLYALLREAAAKYMDEEYAGAAAVQRTAQAVLRAREAVEPNALAGVELGETMSSLQRYKVGQLAALRAPVMEAAKLAKRIETRKKKVAERASKADDAFRGEDRLPRVLEIAVADMHTALAVATATANQILAPAEKLKRKSAPASSSAVPAVQERYRRHSTGMGRLLGQYVDAEEAEKEIGEALAAARHIAQHLDRVDEKCKNVTATIKLAKKMAKAAATKARQDAAQANKKRRRSEPPQPSRRALRMQGLAVLPPKAPPARTSRSGRVVRAPSRPGS